MDTSHVPLLDYGLQYQWCSDSDISSISDPETLSPVPSVDSSLSPNYLQPSESTPRGGANNAGRYSQERLNSKKASSCPSTGGRGRKAGRTRGSRIRSKQRESASEKEKLRMRDLTKAMHHLRTYLPPSVAPAGQTLTKIETLRLTIRYISYLSSQLGLSEEVLFQRRERGDSPASGTDSPDILSYFQCSSVVGQWAQSQSQQSQYLSDGRGQLGSLRPGDYSFGADQGQGGEPTQRDGLDSSAESVLTSPQSTHTASSCQVYGKDFCSQFIPMEYWG